jgi:hypothetical protein
MDTTPRDQAPDPADMPKTPPPPTPKEEEEEEEDSFANFVRPAKARRLEIQSVTALPQRKQEVEYREADCQTTADPLAEPGVVVWRLRAREANVADDQSESSDSEGLAIRPKRSDG